MKRTSTDLADGLERTQQWEKISGT